MGPMTGKVIRDGHHRMSLSIFDLGKLRIIPRSR
jgi:hypothetical protein